MTPEVFTVNFAVKLCGLFVPFKYMSMSQVGLLLSAVSLCACPAVERVLTQFILEAIQVSVVLFSWPCDAVSVTLCVNWVPLIIQNT